MYVLVTGGTGYIGSHTVLELLNNNYKVIIIDNLSNSSRKVIERIELITSKKIVFYELDLLDIDALASVFSKYQISAVMHFAGFKSVGESVEKPTLYYKNNLISTINLCQVMQKYNVKNMVFSSSATVYAPTEKGPISETFPLSASNPYGQTKVMIETLLGDIYRSDNSWSIALLRYFNPIGAHFSGLLGEDPLTQSGNLMPLILRVAAGEIAYLKILGDDYNTIDGTGVRDYIHVVDLAAGHISALESTLKSKGIEPYNLGTGKGYSVLEIISTFEKVTGKIVPYKFEKRRKGDLAICFSDPNKAKVNLGWVSKKTLEDMCGDAWRWQQLNPYGFNTKL